MYKSQRIIIRVSTSLKQELEETATANGYTVSKLIRNLINEYIRQHKIK